MLLFAIWDATPPPSPRLAIVDVGIVAMTVAVIIVDGCSLLLLLSLVLLLVRSHVWVPLLMMLLRTNEKLQH